MKIQKLILVGAAPFLLSFVANATPINITLSDDPLGSSSVLVNDISAGDLSSFGGPGKSPDADLDWLIADVHQYDVNFSASLVVAANESGTSEGTGDITVEAGDYLVLHYGKGPGGIGSGGGAVALYFSTAETFDIPQNGSGPNGNGGISYAELFKGNTTSVLDGGLTMSMLGAAITGMALLKRRVKK